MGKKQYVSGSQLQKELLNRTEGYAEAVRKIYQKSLTEIIDLVKGTQLESGKPFSFSEYGYTDEVQPIFRQMYSKVYQVIRSGANKEWLSAEENNDALVKSIFGEHSIEDNHFAKLFKRNQEAMNAFFSRKTGQDGLSLSQRVWKYTGAYKQELEDALDLAIGEGTAANSLASKIKKYLQDPDKFYRRFRYKVGEDENGKPIYALKWKRRIWSEDDQSYKWIDSDPRKYHPGRGVYRSSARNAQRLARTETNIAYRTADYERWQGFDFVVGVEVKLSNNHPCDDICDTLAGVYPKGFKFVGWHPNCRCYCVPILATEDEMEMMVENMLDGDEKPLRGSVNEVSGMPERFTRWIEDNADKIDNARARGTLPYFIRDNEDIINPKPLTPQDIARARHEARTKADEYFITQKWRERSATYHYAQNMLRAMGGISDVDTTALSEAYRRGDLAAILSEGGKLKAIGKHIYSLDLLDDPMNVARKFSLADADAVHEAVKLKLQKWADKENVLDWSAVPLEVKKKRLEFEISWLPNNYMGKSWARTWEVSQNAYIKELAKVNDAIDWQFIRNSFTDLTSFTNKSSVYKSLMDALRDAILAKDKSKAQALISQLEAKRAEILKKRGGGKGLRSVKFKDSDFTKERKDNAKYFYGSSEANDWFFEQAVKDWQSGTDEEHKAMHQYTVGSAYITEPLRAAKGYYHYYTNRIDMFKKHCELMTNYINRSSLPDDCWIKRDDNSSIVSHDLGIDLNAFKANPSALVGKESKIESFLSCGSNKATRFTGTGVEKNVIYNIYCPKGTMATYAEPFNNYGQYDGRWTGKERPTSLNENEVILQRGTTFRIIKAEYDPNAYTGRGHGMWYIDVEVIAQSPSVIKEVVVESSGFYCKYQ